MYLPLQLLKPALDIGKLLCHVPPSVIPFGAVPLKLVQELGKTNGQLVYGFGCGCQASVHGLDGVRRIGHDVDNLPELRETIFILLLYGFS